MRPLLAVIVSALLWLHTAAAEGRPIATVRPLETANALSGLAEAPPELTFPNNWSQAVEKAWTETERTNREHGICFYRQPTRDGFSYSAEIFAGGEETVTFGCREGVVGEAHTHPHASYTAHSLEDVLNLRASNRKGYEYHGIRGPRGFLLSIRTGRSRPDCLPDVRRGFRNSLIAAATGEGRLDAEEMWTNQMLAAAQDCGAVTYFGSDSRRVSLRHPHRYYWEFDKAGAARVPYSRPAFVPILKSFLWLSRGYPGPIDLEDDPEFRLAFEKHFGEDFSEFGERHLAKLVADFLELQYNGFSVVVGSTSYHSNMIYRSGNRGLNIVALMDGDVPAIRINLVEGSLQQGVVNGTQPELDARPGGHVDRIFIQVPPSVAPKLVKSLRIQNQDGRHVGIKNLLR